MRLKTLYKSLKNNYYNNYRFILYFKQFNYGIVKRASK
jgi:hypothetical protein